MADWVAGLWLLGVGLCVGSFLNVLVHRLPLMLERQWRQEAAALDGGRRANSQAAGDGIPGPDAAAPFNLLRPRSHCPSCARQIPWRENIPLLSWLLLRGKCAGCGARISLRYPIVEALAALAACIAVAMFGVSWLAAAVMAYLWVLLALASIDAEKGLLPDQLTLSLLWGGLLVNLAGGLTTLTNAVAGAAAGYICLWCLYWAFKLATGKEGMGYGDFKLLAAIGAWLGWQALPTVALLAAVGGLIFALGGILLQRQDRHQPMPFGPFLAAAGWLALLFRDALGAPLSL